ncbi:MAG: cupin domain-containing protein [Caulobacteraceae bacterium]
MDRRLIAAFLALAAASPTAAQPGAVHKTTLQQVPFPGPVYDSVMVRTVVDRGGVVARHTHPGLELAYVQSGLALVRIQGRPDRRMPSGSSFAVPEKTPHEVRNVGPGPLTIVSTYVVDRSQPIASPAP